MNFIFLLIAICCAIGLVISLQKSVQADTLAGGKMSSKTTGIICLLIGFFIGVSLYAFGIF